ncbi:MAG: YciI family protein, partial [Dongiaceae bacterium]
MILCLDKPDAAALRAASRAAHLDYLKGFAGQVVAAGPLLSDDGTAMIGSLLLME